MCDELIVVLAVVIEWDIVILLIECTGHAWQGSGEAGPAAVEQHLAVRADPHSLADGRQPRDTPHRGRVGVSTLLLMLHGIL